MSIKYDSKREALQEIIKRATVNATYVVPDLQRPYVWSPKQVTLLVDSLFRGWPFGSLLMWEVKPDCFGDNEGIPHRPFWQVVDRTDEDAESAASSLGQPATYHMVLDGQQRIQSLILALGGDQWGFQLKDSDWAQDLQERRVRPSPHWSKASLCVDLEKFAAEVALNGGKVRKIEVGKILDWVILDRTRGQSTESRPANYVYPLFKAWETSGRFIRLSRFWDIAQRDLSEGEYEELLRPMFREHGVAEESGESLLRSFAQFMRVVENVKNNSFVHALVIESFQLTPQWTKDDYSDAIVNIFTRLNTAGRTLTREEITLAWLKIGWIPGETGGKGAGQCLDDLRDALVDRGLKVETDEIVRLITFVWAVEHRRSGALMDSKDLLKGDLVRSLATTISREWNRLKPHFELGADLIRLRGLPDKSFNGVIVVMAWRLLVNGRFDTLTGINCIQRDNLEKHLGQKTGEFVDRWIFATEWSGVWGDGSVLNFQNFASELNSIGYHLGSCDASTFLESVDQSINRLMDRVLTKAIQHVENLVVKDRKRVHAYHNLLWVWHRLDVERWECSSLPMRTGRKRTSNLEVDHTVADAWWQRAVAHETEEKLRDFSGTDEERSLLGPDGFDNLQDARSFVNLIGNCSLLEKSFNISKSATPMWTFLREVHEFRQGIFTRSEWQSSLLLDDAVTEPDGKTLAQLKSLIQARDVAIRSELKEFLMGKKRRIDINSQTEG